jgi:hypothetical protein
MDMQSRAQHVANLLHKRLREIGEEAHAEGWDGRELFAGLGVAFGQACQAVGIGPSKAVEMINGLDLPELDKRDFSLLVAPNGRPLGKVG